MDRRLYCNSSLSLTACLSVKFSGRLRRSHLEDHLEVRLPHVAAYELQLFGPVLAEEAKETQQCFGRSVWSDPEQSLATFIDLVNQRRRTCSS